MNGICVRCGAEYTADEWAARNGGPCMNTVMVPAGGLTACGGTIEAHDVALPPLLLSDLRVVELVAKLNAAEARIAELEELLAEFAADARQLSVRLANCAITPEKIIAMLGKPYLASEAGIHKP